MVPHTLCTALIEELADSEVAFQFEMSPVIERVAKSKRHGASPRKKFLIGGGVAGTVTFRHPTGPHGSPFVMIAFQPDLGEILKLAIFGDIAGRQVGMIVKDRLASGIVVV